MRGRRPERDDCVMETVTMRWSEVVGMVDGGEKEMPWSARGTWRIHTWSRVLPPCVGEGV
jgi:hypothetical protein